MPLIHRFAERAIKHGRLTIIEHNGRTAHFGRPAAGFPNVTVRGMDRSVARDIAYRLDLGAGEAYMNGRIVIEEGDILDLISLLRLNNPWEQAGAILEPGPLLRFFDAARGRVDRLNWSRRSKRNVAHHYDLDDGLYDLFLDAERQYSCGYFLDPGNSLEQAQTDKLAHIAAKLALQPGQRVLDIGCGWGGLAVYLARHRGVEVLGITLSERQLKFARERAEAEGLSALLKFELIDYRAVTGKFDRIVSVGMFEHVGPPHYKTFFRHCANLLTEQGVMLLHTIGRMSGPGSTDLWTSKYIFPGGYCPALSEIVTASEDRGLILSDVETLRLHYAMTLRHWYARTVAARAQIEALYDDRFYRMWQFYLAGAVVAFQGGSLCNYQLQYTRNRHAIPITRDYIFEGERELQSSIGQN